MENEDPWENYETEPFCRHFGDPHDCEEKCARCGHKCSEHGAGVEDDQQCSHQGCYCAGWVPQEQGC